MSEHFGVDSRRSVGFIQMTVALWLHSGCTSLWITGQLSNVSNLFERLTFHLSFPRIVFLIRAG